jgi:hypothetical protein
MIAKSERNNYVNHTLIQKARATTSPKDTPEGRLDEQHFFFCCAKSDSQSLSISF